MIKCTEKIKNSSQLKSFVASKCIFSGIMERSIVIRLFLSMMTIMKMAILAIHDTSFEFKCGSTRHFYFAL